MIQSSLDKKLLAKLSFEKLKMSSLFGVLSLLACTVQIEINNIMQSTIIFMSSHNDIIYKVYCMYLIHRPLK